MFLERVELRNYKAFVEAAYALGPNGVVLIVGANNSGKTALLSSLDVIAGIKVPVHMSRVGAAEGAVLATFFHTEDERGKLFEGSNVALEWLESQGFNRSRVTFAPFQDRSYISRIETTQADGSFATIATTTLDRAGSGNGTASAAAVPAIVSTTPESADFTLSQSTTGTVIDQVPSGFGQLAWWAQLLNEWRAGVYHFEALRVGTQRDVDSHGTTRLSPTGSDLPQALLHLKSNDDPAWEEIVQIMQDVVPDVGVLATPVEGSRVQIAFHDPHLDAKQNVKDLGTGVEQLLMTVYVGVRQPAGSLVIVEEPETNLHPAAQRALFRYVRAWSKHALFILATHSTVFLDETLGQNRVLLVERSEGTATVREAGQELQEVLRSLGIRLSDVLSAERIVLVEGDTDAEVLREWFPELSVASGTAIAGMGGGDRAWDVDLLPAVLAQVDELGRHVLAFRDRDELPGESVDKLEAGGLVHVLERRELENYLLDDLEAIRRVLDRQAETAPERLPAAPVDEIAEVLRTRAEGLIDEIILKRVVARLKNIRLITRADVRRLCTNGSSLEALIGAVRERIRPEEELLSEIRELWREESKRLQAEWEDRWRELAPGEELLGAIWAKHNGAFDKGRDGVMIAAELAAPPTEFAEALDALNATASAGG